MTRSSRGDEQLLGEMRTFSFLLLSSLLGGVSAGCIHSGKTYNLDEDTFDDFVFKSDHLVTFVEFSSPWCIWANPNTNGHGDCATMRKAWDQLGETYNFSHAVSVAEVDCSRFVVHEPDAEGKVYSRESLCQRFHINSYPTVMVFTGETGAAGANYTGKQTYAAMHAFLERERKKLCLLDPEKGKLQPGPACGEDEQKFLAQWRDEPPESALTELLRLEAIISNREVTFGASKRAWMGKRINLLKQIRVAHRPPEEELKVEL